MNVGSQLIIPYFKGVIIGLSIIGLVYLLLNIAIASSTYVSQDYESVPVETAKVYVK